MITLTRIFHGNFKITLAQRLRETAGLRSFFLDAKFRRAAFLSAVVLACLSYLGRQAFFDPETEFLAPSFRGDWIVHPRPRIRFRGYPGCEDTIFSRVFRLESVPGNYYVAITAMRGYKLQINGHALETEMPENWKSPTRIDIAGRLKQGKNEIELRVFGPKNPGALLLEGPPEIRSGTGWKVRYDSKKRRWRKEVAAVPALRGEHYLLNKKNAFSRSKHRKLWIALFAVYLLFIIYSLMPISLKPWMSRSLPGRISFPRSRGLRFIARHGPCILIVLLTATLQFRNTARYPYRKAPFDSRGHAEYIRHVSSEWKTPLPTDGWEMFQPPAYYFSSAALCRIFGTGVGKESDFKTAQFLTTAMGILNILAAWAVLAIIFPWRYTARFLGTAVAAILPMGFYMNSLVTNEVFAGSVIALGLALAIKCLSSPSKLLNTAAPFICGLACAAALLSKYTGLFLTITIFAYFAAQLLRRPASRRSWLRISCFGGVVLLLAGWLYLRNYRLYEDPFIGNWDEASGYHYEEEPGYRTLGFYTRFGTVFSHIPEHSRWSSFADGEYGSMWGDSHHAFYRKPREHTRNVTTVIYALALLPSVAILIGFIKSIRIIVSRGLGHRLTIPVLLSILTVTGVLSFTLENPSRYVIKAFFFLSLIPCIGLFSGIGLQIMIRQLGRLKYLLYAGAAALAGLVIYLFGNYPLQ